MILSRRNFLTSFAAGVGLVAAEPVRRYWALGAPTSWMSETYCSLDFGLLESSTSVTIFVPDGAGGFMHRSVTFAADFDRSQFTRLEVDSNGRLCMPERAGA